MARDKLVRRFSVAELAPTLGELELSIPLEHRETTDVGEIPLRVQLEQTQVDGVRTVRPRTVFDAPCNRSVVRTLDIFHARNSSGTQE